MKQELQRFISYEECGRFLMEEVQDYAIFQLDTAGKVISWNEGAKRILGYEDHEIVGKTSSTIFTVEDRVAGEFEKELITAEELGRAEDERWHVKKDGTKFWASGILACSYDCHGACIGFIKILRDVTEKRQYQEAIEQLNEKLKQAMQETHHRVKNNLQLIGALLDMKVMSTHASIPKEEIRGLSLHVQALASVHDLLTREFVGDSEKQISGKVIIDKLLDLMQQTAMNREIIRTLDDVPLSSKQAISLGLILNELVSNAFKHCRGKIEVNFIIEDLRAVLAVCDDGKGFPPNFNVTDSANMGLELVDRLGRWDLKGDVAFDTKSTGGGVVTVSFPLRTELIN